MVSEDEGNLDSVVKVASMSTLSVTSTAATEAAVSPTKLLLPTFLSGKEMPGELTCEAQDMGCGSPESLHSGLLQV